MLVSQIYQENVRVIFRYFRIKTLSKEVAEDLTSETFLRLVAKKESIAGGDITNARAFLYGIARNVWLEYLREKYKQEINLSINELDFQQHIQDYTAKFASPSDRMAQLKTLISQLPEKQKVVISLRLVEGKTLAQISQIMEKDNNYVRTTQKRAIASLKILWECTQSDTNILELTQNHD